MLTRILTASCLIIVSLLALFLLPFQLFLALVDLVLLLAYLELNKIIRQNGQGMLQITPVFLLSLPWIWNFAPHQLPIFLVAAITVLLFWTLPTSKGDLKSCLSRSSLSLFSIFYLGVPFSILTTYQAKSPSSVEDPSLIWKLMLVFTAIWISDSAAYFVGRVIGRHKITPRISPNKSLEGFAAGIIFPAIGAMIYGWLLLPGIPTWFIFLTGLLLGISGIMGDLFESALKRGSGIKDSSRLFPGHGGILDRTDSILTGILVFYLLMEIWRYFE